MSPSLKWARTGLPGQALGMKERCSVLGQQVCSNDNKTFDSSCHFFATKCTLEGTKKGHKLHMDYIGPCKCECAHTF